MNRSYRSRRQQAAVRLPRAKPSPRQVQSLALTGVILVVMGLLLKAGALVMISQGGATVEFGPVNDSKDLSVTLSPFLQVLSSAATIVTAGGWLQLIGAVFVTYAFHGGECRGRWFFWSMLALALLVVWQPVIGTVFGAWWLWCLVWTRHEFFSKQAILTSA